MEAVPEHPVQRDPIPSPSDPRSSIGHSMLSANYDQGMTLAPRGESPRLQP